MTDRPDLPWVLLRRGRPVIRFTTADLGKRFYDRLRFNSGASEDASLFGPNGEAWYCPRLRSAEWTRDDNRRKREAPADASGEPA